MRSFLTRMFFAGLAAVVFPLCSCRSNYYEMNYIPTPETDFVPADAPPRLMEVAIAMLLSKTGISWMIADVNVFPMLAFILAAFAAVRLAKFNIDTRQTSSFIGLPVPAVGLFVASLPFANLSFVENPYFLLAMVAIFSWLMISEVPFFSFKIKNLRFKDNILRYFVVIFAIIAVIILQLVALPFIFLFYILLSVICYRGE